MENLTPLTNDVALYAFMDGELDVLHEQSLFNELAANPELRSEMKDLLSIRNAVHRDIIVPPTTSEASILAAAGLSPLAGAAVVAPVAAAPALTWLTSLYALGGIIVGGLAVWLLMANGIGADTTVVAGRSSMDAASLATNVPARVDTVVSIVPATALERSLLDARAAVLNGEWSRLEDAQRTLANERRAFDAERKEFANRTSAMAQAFSDPTSTALTMQETTASMQATITLPPSASIVRAETSLPTVPMLAAESSSANLPVQFRLRSLASGLRSDRPTPQALQDALIPNSAFLVSVPLTEHHRVGIEMGSESFEQVFNGAVGGRPVEFRQTPVLFWVGANYRFTAAEFSVLPGLRPFVESTIGMAFSQGPAARGSAGLVYHPGGPLAFTVGLDASALFFRHSGQWYSSSKFGFTYGLSVDLGAWK
jgi:hypothetical protein